MAGVVAHGVLHDVVGHLLAEARSDNIRVAEVDPAVDAGIDDLIDTLAEGSPGVVEVRLRWALGRDRNTRIVTKKRAQNLRICAGSARVAGRVFGERRSRGQQRKPTRIARVLDRSDRSPEVVV